MVKFHFQLSVRVYSSLHGHCVGGLGTLTHGRSLTDLDTFASPGLAAADLSSGGRRVGEEEGLDERARESTSDVRSLLAFSPLQTNT